MNMPRLGLDSDFRTGLWPYRVLCSSASPAPLSTSLALFLDGHWSTETLIGSD